MTFIWILIIIGTYIVINVYINILLLFFEIEFCFIIKGIFLFWLICLVVYTLTYFKTKIPLILVNIFLLFMCRLWFLIIFLKAFLWLGSSKHALPNVPSFDTYQHDAVDQSAWGANLAFLSVYFHVSGR